MAYTVKVNGTDITGNVRSGSIAVTKTSDIRNSCSLTVMTTGAEMWITGAPVVGRDLQVFDGATLIFGGIIKTTQARKMQPGVGGGKEIFLDVSSNGYSDIPARRITTSSYSNATSGSIVSNILANVLNASGADENISTGTIGIGATMKEYSVVCKSVKEVFDDLAEASGFKWYIGNDRALHFVQDDTVVSAAHELRENGEFKDFSVESVEITLENYRNKQFVRGTADDTGDIVVTFVDDSAEIAFRQSVEGSEYSSGVYGDIIDASVIGSIADATVAANNALKRYGSVPYTLTFTSMTNDWAAGTKLTVNLPSFGISNDTYFLIESVYLEDIDGVFRSTVTATRRKTSDFSTQRTENYKDYFAKIVKAKGERGGGSVVYDSDGVAYSVQIYVQPLPPSQAKGKDVYIDTDDYSRFDFLTVIASAIISESDSEMINASGNSTITLHSAASPGIVKRIHNTGTGIITLSGTINGASNMYLYPRESVTLVTDGSGWRA